MRDDGQLPGTDLPPHSRIGLAWYLCAVMCAVFIGSPHPVYWDSFDYVTQALTGHVGGLGVGRPVFALATHSAATLWQWVGGSVWDVEPVLLAWWRSWRRRDFARTDG